MLLHRGCSGTTFIHCRRLLFYNNENPGAAFARDVL
jgi:hypothetical protein